MGQRHPAGLVERVGAVGGLALAAYGGHDREPSLGVVGVDTDDVQRRRSVVSTGSTDGGGSTDAGRSTDGDAAGASFAGSTKR